MIDVTARRSWDDLWCDLLWFFYSSWSEIHSASFFQSQTITQSTSLPEHVCHFSLWLYLLIYWDISSDIPALDLLNWATNGSWDRWLCMESRGRYIPVVLHVSSSHPGKPGDLWQMLCSRLWFSCRKPWLKFVLERADITLGGYAGVGLRTSCSPLSGQCLPFSGASSSLRTPAGLSSAQISL